MLMYLLRNVNLKKNKIGWLDAGSALARCGIFCLNQFAAPIGDRSVCTRLWSVDLVQFKKVIIIPYLKFLQFLQYIINCISL